MQNLGQRNVKPSGDAAHMEWDGPTLKAWAGIAAVIASAALLLAGVGLVVPMIGLVAGVAAMLGASLERFKLRVEALEKSPQEDQEDRVSISRRF
jgi:hypothetical protein